MVELTAYSVKLRKKVEIKNPKLEQLSNGRWAVKGVASEDPTSKVIRILSNAQKEEVEKMLG